MMRNFVVRSALVLACLVLLGISHVVASTTTDVDESVFVNSPPNSLVFDVTTYGAVNDGRTDCTTAVFTAVQALINATLQSPSSPYSAILYFPAGSFLLNSAPPLQEGGYYSQAAFVDFTGVTASQSFSLSVVGAGMQTTTVLWNSTYGSFLQSVMASGTSNPSNSITLSNMTLNTAQSGRAGNLFNIQGAKDVVISNSDFALDWAILGFAYASSSLTFVNTMAFFNNPGGNCFLVSAPTISFGDSTIVASTNTIYYGIYVMNGTPSITALNLNVKGWQSVFFIPESSSPMSSSAMSIQLLQSTFSDFTSAVLVSGPTSQMDLEISGSTFTTTATGRTAVVNVQGAGNASSITMTGSTINGAFAAVQITVPVSLVMDSNIIQNVSYGVLFLSDSGSPLGGSIDGAMKPFSVTNNTFSEVRMGVATFMQTLTAAALPGSSTFDGNTCEGPVIQVIAPCEEGQTCSFNKNQGCQLLQAQPLQKFDVTTFGAVGDGQTDCTQAVLNATAALMSSASGGQLYFPKGTYLVNSAPTPCAKPGYGSCAYIALMTVTAFTLPGARFVVNGDPNGGTTILWGSFQGQFIQYEPDLFVASSTLEVFDLTIQAQASSSPVTGNYTAVSAVGTYAYVHDVDIIGAVGSSGPLMFTSQGGGSCMLVESVNLRMDAEVGVGFYVDETSGLAFHQVSFDSIDGSVGVDSLTARAISFGEYSSSILIDSCTFLPGSRMLYWGGDNDANPFIFLLRNNSFHGVQLYFKTELTVTVDHCTFLAGAGGVGGIVLATDYLFENTFLTVTSSVFQDLQYGIFSGWGRVTASNNWFQNCTVGVQYSDDQQRPPVSQPVVLLNNQFDTTLSSQLGVVVSGNGWIVSNNTCTGPANPSMEFSCNSQCTHSNNVGCGVQSMSDSEDRSFVAEQ